MFVRSPGGLRRGVVCWKTVTTRFGVASILFVIIRKRRNIATKRFRTKINFCAFQTVERKILENSYTGNPKRIRRPGGPRLAGSFRCSSVRETTAKIENIFGPVPPSAFSQVRRYWRANTERKLLSVNFDVTDTEKQPNKNRDTTAAICFPGGQLIPKISGNYT